MPTVCFLLFLILQIIIMVRTGDPNTRGLEIIGIRAAADLAEFICILYLFTSLYAYAEEKFEIYDRRARARTEATAQNPVLSP